MRKTGRIAAALRRGLTLLAALALLIPAGLAPGSRAVTRSEIDALKKNSSSLSQQKAALQQQLKSINADKSKAMDQKSLLEQQINVIQSEINNIDAQISKYDELIAEKQQELEQNEAEEARLYELFCQRVRSMEEEGNTNYWAILFNAASFQDLLDRLIMVDEIMEYDNAVMNDLIAKQEQIKADKQELEQARAEQQEARDRQVAARKELKDRESDVDKLISQISAEASSVQASVRQLEAQARAMDAEIARKEKELAAQLSASGTKITSESGYLWPLSGYTNLSSLFAGRIDPFTGRRATHTGIDVPAPRGTKVLAAKSGVVITSAYNAGGYGNYVVVSHGNGNTTLYAHLSSRSVKEGDSVKQGQTVGLVGTTGRSTGNHLHYEIRVNNVRIDPVTKYKGLTYKGRAL